MWKVNVNEVFPFQYDAFIIYFPSSVANSHFDLSCSGRTISLHHPFTPSLRVRHLETQQSRGQPYEKAGNTRQKIQM